MNIVRPEPYPDELAEGYAGRVRQRNGWRDKPTTWRELQAWLGCSGQSLREISTIELLASVSGMDLHTFVQQHSLLPLRRAITMKAPGLLLGGERQTTTLWALALRPMRAGLYFCPMCIAEDVGFHGESYWRREHQIPGQCRCFRHRCPLYYSQTYSVCMSGPAAAMETALQARVFGIENDAHAAAAERYHEICSHLLHVESPRNETAVSRLARKRAGHLGFHVSKGAVKKPLISDRIKGIFCNEWLEELVPGLANFTAGQFFAPIDTIVQGKSKGTSVLNYALIFAVMFDDADEAANAIISTMLSRPCLKLDRVKRRNATQEQLKACYISRAGSHSAVARALDVEVDWASAQLISQGLPRLGKRNINKVRHLLWAVLLGSKTIDEACVLSGICPRQGRNLMSIALAPLLNSLAGMSASCVANERAVLISSYSSSPMDGIATQKT